MYHPGIQTTYLAVKKFLKIKNLTEEIRNQRNNSIMCQNYMRKTHKYGKFSLFIHITVRFQEISSVMVGLFYYFSFEEGREENKFYFLTITNKCTRWSEVYLLKS